MKKNYWTTGRGEDENLLFVGVALILGGFASVIGAVELSFPLAPPLFITLATACLLSASYLAYRECSAPLVSRGDEGSLRHSWEIIKDARRIARNPLLRGDSDVKAVVTALTRDHQELVWRAQWNHKVLPGQQGELQDLQAITANMVEGHAALREALREREAVIGAEHLTSTEATRKLRESTQVTATVRRTLSE